MEGNKHVNQPERIRLRQPEPAAAPPPRKRKQRRIPLAGRLGILLFFLFWCSVLFMIPYRQWVWSPAWVLASVRNRFGQLYLFFFRQSSAFGITLYQYLAVMLAGAALAACGAVFQGSFRNILAGPSTMGVTSGGSLGCLLYLVLAESAGPMDLEAYLQRSLWGIYQQQLLILAGCFLSVGITLLAASAAGGKGLSAPAMLLCGAVLSGVADNLSLLLQYVLILQDPLDPRIEALRSMMMGSMNGITSFRTVALMGIPILLCLAVLLLLSGKLDLLSLGAEEAAAMGVDVRLYRYAVIVIGTVLTATVLAFCGRIGFLGFMVPLIGRKLAGPCMRRLLPVSMLLGAILLMLIFDAAAVLGLTDYLNLFTSAIGAAALLLTLLGKRGGTSYAA